MGDPHKLHGGSVHHEHRGVVGARFVGQNRLWFLTFKSCAAGPRIMSISGCGCPGPHGGWVGGWVWVAGWVGGWVASSAHHARSSGTGNSLDGRVGGVDGWLAERVCEWIGGWVGWVGLGCVHWLAAAWLAGWVGWAVGWVAGQCGWVVCWAGGWLVRGFFLN